MSKKNYRHDEWTYGYEEDYYGDRDHIEDVTHKRKIKRMKTALRQKNIDDLLSLDDDY
jgi:hypothetical protein